MLERDLVHRRSGEVGARQIAVLERAVLQAAALPAGLAELAATEHAVGELEAAKGHSLEREVFEDVPVKYVGLLERVHRGRQHCTRARAQVAIEIRVLEINASGLANRAKCGASAYQVADQ